MIGTYRLQLTPAFTLDHAAAVAPYLADLGVSHVYLSPIFEARPGSEHGYDQTDPTRIRAELGGEGAFARLVAAVRGRGMGIVVDIVPNHMAAHHLNPWWWDVLARGRASAHAGWFDIDWDAGGGRVVLPVLGAGVEEVIEKGELSVERGEDGRERLRYFDRLLPLAEGTAPREGATAAELRACLEKQHYELAFWRRGLERLNYRRFFDVSDLVGVCAEREDVFEAMHGRLLALAAAGAVDGVRVDHIDGLRDPEAYLARLRRRLDEAGVKSRPRRRVFLLVEKILGEHERLPESWPVDGTTGYEFLVAAGAAGIDPGMLAERRRHAAARGIAPADFASLRIECKALVAAGLFKAELGRLVDLAGRALSAAGEGFCPHAVREALIGVSAHLPVYRTYGDAGGLSAVDAERLEGAVGAARLGLPDFAACSAAEHLGAMLRLQTPFDRGAAREAAAELLARWQQFTGPLAAKGVEDTALYRDATLLALNEVGGEPVAVEPHVRLVGILRERAEGWPLSLNASSTHDTKRSEDVRARIAALSQVWDEWTAASDRWRTAHHDLRTSRPAAPAPSDLDEAILYQTIVGLGGVPADEQQRAETAERLKAYMVKAAREAKVRTSWLEPSAAYESGCEAFVDGLVMGEIGAGFRAEINAIAARCAAIAAGESLGLVLLKTLAPGVPDFYQGTEFVFAALVDPDNRRPVDFEARWRALDDLRAEWMRDPEACAAAALADLAGDGAKLFITWRALACRRWLMEGSELADPSSARLRLEAIDLGAPPPPPATSSPSALQEAINPAVVYPSRRWTISTPRGRRCEVVIGRPSSPGRCAGINQLGVDAGGSLPLGIILDSVRELVAAPAKSGDRFV